FTPTSPVINQEGVIEQIVLRIRDIETLIDKEKREKYKSQISNYKKEEKSASEFIEFYKNSWLDGVEKGISRGNSAFPIAGSIVGGLIAAGVDWFSIGTAKEIYTSKKTENTEKPDMSLIEQPVGKQSIDEEGFLSDERIKEIIKFLEDTKSYKNSGVFNHYHADISALLKEKKYVDGK
ncbi:11672_t:CDS:2, partial [Cetraspora pellucida]